jgi:2-methylfumaryl-CoA hydratase
MAAWNGGSHTNPTFAGDTLFAFTEVLERIEIGRDDVGGLRLRLVGVKNVDPSQEEIAVKTRDDESGRERYDQSVVLDLEYVGVIPKRAASIRA